MRRCHMICALKKSPLGEAMYKQQAESDAAKDAAKEDVVDGRNKKSALAAVNHGADSEGHAKAASLSGCGICPRNYRSPNQCVRMLSCRLGHSWPGRAYRS